MLGKSILFNLRRYWWFVGVIVCIAVIGVLGSCWAANKIDQSIRSSLIKRAETVAAALHSDLIANLSGTEQDLDNQNYHDLKQNLSMVREKNLDLRFVYVLGLKNKQVFFYADSESADSVDYSPPGQIYFEASEQLLQAFDHGQSFVEGPLSDRWGNWLSALAPIFDSHLPGSRTVVGIVGMDISNHSRQTLIFGVAALIIGATLLVEFLFFVSYFYLRRRKKIKQYEFVSMLSHQLRTPISAIRALIEVSKDGKKLTGRDMDNLYNKIIHLNNIVGTLLFFVENKNVLNQKKLTLEKTSDLSNVVRNQLKFLQKEIAKKKITVDVKLPDTLIVAIDDFLLNRIIYTLIENAIIYNRDAGNISISLKKDHGHPILCVIDSGYGIPRKEQDKLFKPFFRATNASLGMNEGSGLSLHIVNEIMRLVGGKITFQSEEGKGTVFCLHF